MATDGRVVERGAGAVMVGESSPPSTEPTTAMESETEQNESADNSTSSGKAAWERAVCAVKASPELRESILRSVMSSMAIEGFAVDLERSDQLLEEALNGPPLVYPGDE